MARKYGTSHFFPNEIWSLWLFRLICLSYFITEGTLPFILSSVERVRAYVMTCQAHASISRLPSPRVWGSTFPFPHLLSAVMRSAGALTLRCRFLAPLLCLFHPSACGMARAATTSGTWAHVHSLWCPFSLLLQNLWIQLQTNYVLHIWL